MRARTWLIAALAAAALPAIAADNRIRIADEGKIGDEWSLVPATQLMPPYPEAYARDPEEVCLVVGYLVNADGSTSDFSLLKSWTSGSNSRARKDFWADFADMSSRALAQWRYAPQGAGSKPVYTAATFVFGAPANAADTKTHCEVSDLTQRLVELRYDPRSSRLMKRGIYSQLAIDPGVEERFRLQTIANREVEDRAQAAANVRNEKAESAARQAIDNAQ
ncbi:MAG: hypothetical protein ACTHOC_09975 [Luteimonas sp.]